MRYAKRTNALRLGLVVMAIAAAGPGMAADDLLVVSGPAGAVLRYDAQSGANRGALFITPTISWNSARVGPDGALWVAGNTLSDNTAIVRRYDLDTGDLISTRILGRTDLVTDIVFDAFGHVYLSYFTLDRVDQHTLDGVLQADYIAPGEGGLNGPTGMTFDANGRLYVSSRISGQVLRYTSGGVSLGVFAAPGGNGPEGLAFGPDGHLWVCRGDIGQILRFDGISGASLGVFANVPSGGAGMSVAFVPSGEVLVSQFFASSVLRLDSAGNSLGSLFPTGRGGVQLPSRILLRPRCEADINNDGRVDLADLSVMLATFGAVCP